MPSFKVRTSRLPVVSFYVGRLEMKALRIGAIFIVFVTQLVVGESKTPQNSATVQAAANISLCSS